MTEWKEYKMSDLIDEIAMGPFGSNIKVDCFVGSGIPVLNGSNLVGFRLNEEAFNYVTKEKADSLGHSNAYRGDVVVTHRGTLGQIVYIPEDSKYDRYVISQSQFRFVCKKGLVYVPYLVYYFHSREGQYKLLANASQVGVPALARPTSSFKEVIVSLPSLPTQRRIAAILSSLDDKIDLLHRENATLEQMAETLFRQWFIEDAKEDWEEGKLGDICNYVNEKIDIGNVETGDYISTENMCPNKQGVVLASSVPENGKATKYRIDDVLLSNIRPYFKKIWLSDREGGCSADVLCIRGKNELYAFFSYYTIRQDEFFDYVMLGSKGCKMPRGDKSHIMNWPIIIPPKDELLKFNEIAKQGITKIRNNNKQIRTLIQMRDELLPKLMSNEINVK